MRVERVTWSHRNDFNALMKCEHCGHEQESKGLYNDTFYYERVIPARHYCGRCGLNGLGEKSPSATEADADKLELIAEVREDKRLGKMFIATLGDADLEPGMKLYARAATTEGGTKPIAGAAEPNDKDGF